MIHASSVTFPSLSGKPPKPTLLFEASDSVTLTPASTASNALPPLSSFSQAALFAAIP